MKIDCAVLDPRDAEAGRLAKWWLDKHQGHRVVISATGSLKVACEDCGNNIDFPWTMRFAVVFEGVLGEAVPSAEREAS